MHTPLIAHNKVLDLFCFTPCRVSQSLPLSSSVYSGSNLHSSNPEALNVEYPSVSVLLMCRPCSKCHADSFAVMVEYTLTPPTLSNDVDGSELSSVSTNIA